MKTNATIIEMLVTWEEGDGTAGNPVWGCWYATDSSTTPSRDNFLCVFDSDEAPTRTLAEAVEAAISMLDLDLSPDDFGYESQTCAVWRHPEHLDA